MGDADSTSFFLPLAIKGLMASSPPAKGNLLSVKGSSFLAIGKFCQSEVMVMQVPDWTKDNAAGRKILQHHGLQVFESPIHLEGGSIHTDGEG